MFDIPIVLFMYRRLETTIKIIDMIATVQPRKVYLISDGGKTPEIHNEIVMNRKIIEERINWECEVITNYSDNNRGVYFNIGEGAKWVFKQEEMAIFLEDDNLPKKEFFIFAEEMLLRYKDDNRILWICGTNYLEKYNTPNKESYVFTQHLMPCGWASWSHKFLNMYDGKLESLNKRSLDMLEKTYANKALYKQQRYSIERTKLRLDTDINSASWDFQMAYSIRHHNAYGISPKVNLIKNIGVDSLSTHGGSSLNRVMTDRFCSIDSYKLDYPLIHPETIEIDPVYEDKVGKIILYPLHYRVAFYIARRLKRLFGMGKYDSIDEKIRRLKNGQK